MADLPEWGEFLGDTKPTRDDIEKRLREHPLLIGVTGFLNAIGPGESVPYDNETKRMKPYWVIVFGTPGRIGRASQSVAQSKFDHKPMNFRIMCYAEKRDLANLCDRVTAAIVDFAPVNSGPIEARFTMEVSNPTVVTANQPRDGLAMIFSCPTGIETPNAL